MSCTVNVPVCRNKRGLRRPVLLRVAVLPEGFDTKDHL